MKEYIRDSRSPTPLNEKTSRVMSANHPKGTSPEILMVSTLSSLGVASFAQNVKVADVNVDVVFMQQHVAVFIHGCYWHRCPHCQTRSPQHNRDFWLRKFAANQRRDRRNVRRIRSLGWSVFSVWECRLKQSPVREAARIVRALID